MNRTSILAYGIFSYFFGLASLMYFFAFVGGWEFLPVHVHSTWMESTNPYTAFIINVSLVALFGIQHSVMARGWFKKILTNRIPEAAERSTYVLLSGILMFLICFLWQPLPGTIWDFENQFIRNTLMTIQITGWTLTVVSSFIINHFELFGLQQVYCNFREVDIPEPKFTDRLFYKFVRHPLQFGLLVGLWSAPTMSVTLLLLSATMSIYIFIGLFFEERDLVKYLGDDYKEYKNQVPKLIPIKKAA